MTGQEWPLALAQLAHKAWKALVAEGLCVSEKRYRKVNYFPLTRKDLGYKVFFNRMPVLLLYGVNLF